MDHIFLGLVLSLVVAAVGVFLQQRKISKLHKSLGRVSRKLAQCQVALDNFRGHPAKKSISVWGFVEGDVEELPVEVTRYDFNVGDLYIIYEDGWSQTVNKKDIKMRAWPPILEAMVK